MTTGPSEDGGFFAASVVYGHDRARTHVAVAEAGVRAFRALMQEAATDPAPADSLLLQRIHRDWFQTAFPEEAGRFRRVEVLSRRPRVSPPHAIANDVAGVFVGFEPDWIAAGGDWRREHIRSKAQLHRVLCMANSLAVRLHHIHPFLDGNTRACLTLRSYLLVRAGLPPVTGGYGEGRSRLAWNAAEPHAHTALDHLLYEQLADTVGRL